MDCDTFILLDALGLVEEDYCRHGDQINFADLLSIGSGSIDFVNSLAPVCMLQ